MGEITVKDTDPGPSATVTFLDIHGHETEPDDVPQWSSDNEAVATVAASDDGKSATVSLPGEVGAAVISVQSTDTDGTVVLSQGTITVQPSEAVIGSVEFTPGA